MGQQGLAMAEKEAGRDTRVQAKGRQAAGEGASAGGAEGRAPASTIGYGASARSAEGGPSASTIGKGAGARSEEGRASASTIG